MSFFNQFMSYFTKEEQETDIVRLWATIGVNVEKTLLEEISAQNHEMSDMNNFLPETYESWLAFFMRKIRNRVAPKAKVTLTMNEAGTVVNIPAKTRLTSPAGTYITLESISISQGQTVMFTAMQGEVVSTTVSDYNQYIKLRATNVDLDTLEIKLNGNVVPEISYESSYGSTNYKGSVYVDANGLLKISSNSSSNSTLKDGFGEKGDYYDIIDSSGLVVNSYLTKLNGITVHSGGRIIYDGSYWTVEDYDRSLLPYQLQNEYGIPQNGYFAYYSDNYLYIKIFSGNDVTDPTGGEVSISYVSTNGVQGEIEENVLDFYETIYDINGNEIDYTITNQKSTLGLNEISRGQLNMMLRQSLFTNTSISSIPEYNAWFNAQPEIGSAYCYSDFEEYMRTGTPPTVPTGVVNVYAVDRNGNDVYSNTALASELIGRLTPYKDIATVAITQCNVSKVRFDVKYHSCTDDSAFTALVKSTISNYFNVDFLRENNSSLFDDLNIPQIILDIGNSYSVKGLSVDCYYYISTDFNITDTPSPISIPSQSKMTGAKYLYSKLNADGTYGVADSEGNLRPQELVEQSISSSRTELYLNGGLVAVRKRTNDGDVLEFQSSFQEGKFEISVPTKEDGILTQEGRGSIRQLPADTEYLQMKPIDVEKYSDE